MSIFRFIARLDVKGENVVKGIQLDGLRIVGTPLDLAGKYLEVGIDEIFLSDVVASLYKRPNLSSLSQNLANNLRIPMTVVGGIGTLSLAREVFNSGADKVGINSAGFKSPKLITEISRIYGSQSVISSIEAKHQGGNSWTCMTESGRNETGVLVTDWLREVENLGAGEVVITSVDQDGTNRGPDFKLCNVARESTELPLIYSGGIRNEHDILEIARIGLDGVALGSSLHYGKLDLEKAKRFLAENGIAVRELISS